MRALIFSLFVLISGGVSAQSLAQAPEWGRCLAAYVSVGERETLIKIRPESKQADGMVKFPIHPSCQGLGIVQVNGILREDRYAEYLRFEMTPSQEPLMIRGFDPAVQLAIHAQLARTQQQFASHSLVLPGRGGAALTYFVESRSGTYREYIMWGQVRRSSYEP